MTSSYAGTCFSSIYSFFLITRVERRRNGRDHHDPRAVDNIVVQKRLDF